jgi:hypothetical protein
LIVSFSAPMSFSRASAFGQTTFNSWSGATPCRRPRPVMRASFHYALPPGLQAGPQSVQVLHRVPLGESAVPHSGFTSNAGEFVLHPEIARVGPNLPNRHRHTSRAAAPPRGPRMSPSLRRSSWDAPSTGDAGIAHASHCRSASAGPAHDLMRRIARPMARRSRYRVVDVPAGTYLARHPCQRGAGKPDGAGHNSGQPEYFGQPIAPTMTLP